ncbi:MAG: EpsG family protein [Weeksellaceae bacterium]|nr:EpsG family protein [Weeksellaceae bacterium]
MSFIYNMIVFLVLISSIYEFITGEEPNKNLFKTIVVIMIFTAGLAYGLSPDWVPYWTAFEDVSMTSFSELKELSRYWDMEYGYILLNKLISSIGLGYATFTLLIAIIAISLKTMVIFRYGGYVFLALLMYIVPTYFFEEHVHVRQGLASAIMFFSIRFIIERNLWKFLLCFVIAFYFHKAVVAFLFAYWIVKIPFNNLLIISAVGGAMLAYLIGLSTVVDGIFRLLPFGVGEAYSDYANEFTEKSILGDIVKVLTVIAILLFNKKVEEKDDLFAYFRNIYLFGVIIYFFFGEGIFAARLPGFFTVYIIFVVPRMVKALSDTPLFKNFVYIMFTVYTLALYINFYNVWGDKSGFGRYTTVFNDRAVYGFFQKY